MTALPEYGVFSTHSLLLDTLGSNIGRDALVKRMAILFDKLVFFPIGLGPIGTSNSLFTKERIIEQWVGGDADALKSIDQILLLDHELIEDVDGFYKTHVFGTGDDLWSGESSEEFIRFVRSYVDERFPEDERWEQYKIHIGYINSDFRLCQAITHGFDNCSALVTELHEKAVLETLAQPIQADANQISAIVSDLNTVDFGALSWAQIFELRKSGFISDYRNRIAEWVVSESTSEVEAISFNLDVFIKNSLFDLLEITEPNVRETIFSGIGGNLPSPIGINPFSVYSAFKDARTARELKAKFGWLYFVQRARRSTIQKTPE